MTKLNLSDRSRFIYKASESFESLGNFALTFFVNFIIVPNLFLKDNLKKL